MEALSSEVEILLIGSCTVLAGVAGARGAVIVEVDICL